MPSQLDILALEPFYGGARKLMLETIIRYSRHRWTLLRLPPRRIERRLAAAALWFSELLLRHWVGRVDVLFTSEALNLADLLRQVPALTGKPSVVYFHDNQLPPVGERAETPQHLVNLSTASAATELWFNSLYHLKTFLTKAGSLVEKHPELSGRNPLPQMADKSQLMVPPVDFDHVRELLGGKTVRRDPRLLFVDTRDANIPLLNQGLATLRRRGEKYRLVTVGPLDGFDENHPRVTIPEQDEAAQVAAIHEAAVVISARPGASADHHAVRALWAGCWPIFPASGVYPELLPKSIHELCLYNDAEPNKMGVQLQNVWWLEHPAKYRDALATILEQYNALTVVKAIDDRLEELAGAGSAR